MRSKIKNGLTSVLKDSPLKSVQKGQVILKESPFVYGLNASLRYEKCDFCFSSDKVLKCSSCKYVSYCNRECQRMGWKVHKDECLRLKKMFPRVVPDAARIIARIVFKLKQGGGHERGFYTKSNFRVFKDLMSHYSDIKQDTKRLEHFTVLYNVLLEYIGEDDMPNSAELMGIYGRLVVNGFNIINQEMEGIGTGIYLGVSIIDHSCDPTATPVFQGTTIHIRSLVDMAEFDWSKVFITYIELLNSRQERQQDLMASYYFLCECSRCKDIEEIKLSNSMCCPNSDCGAPIAVESKDCAPNEDVHLYCNECKENVKPDLLRQYLETYDFVSEKLQNMKDFAYLDVAKLCLEKQGELFHPLNLQRVKTLDAAFEGSVSVNLWKQAKTYGQLLLPGFKQYYGQLHPLTGLLLLKLGKICLNLDNFVEARRFLGEAQDILCITHGRDHPVFTMQLLPLRLQAYYNI